MNGFWPFLCGILVCVFARHSVQALQTSLVGLGQFMETHFVPDESGGRPELRIVK